jgi:hypothetical protein
MTQFTVDYKLHGVDHQLVLDEENLSDQNSRRFDELLMIAIMTHHAEPGDDQMSFIIGLTPYSNSSENKNQLPSAKETFYSKGFSNMVCLDGDTVYSA